MTEPGGTPFHLQAVITERADPNENIDIEMSWVAPDKWRRVIRSQGFSQTLIVNGDKVFEQDSDDYFPLGIQVLATAMVDPKPILDAVRPGDRVLTKANGASDESGRTCFDAARRMCGVGRYGLMESLGAPGRSMDFMDYQKFKGKRAARLLVLHIDPGDSLQARVTTLGEFKSDETPFLISEPTPKEKQIRSVIVPESELLDLALQPAEVIWPQVLEDNRTTGETSYYVSLDRSGQVREILPLSVEVERADDSARRQIMKWRFKPVIRDGVPVQAEAVLNFHFDTRAYGPRSPLTDAEVRKLATNTIDPEFPPGTPTGATCNIRIAVDSDGRVIEEIAVDGTPRLGTVCMRAIGKWRFSPILENGQPRPYRAEIAFRVP
ncbi:MAG: energy transducer TonB [Candidatus Sulfotelmatobacter sp.]